MKLLNLFKNLFKKEKKELSPREMVIFNGLPEELKLRKKNLIICDMADAIFTWNGNRVAVGDVNISNTHKVSDNKVTLNLMYLSNNVPEGDDLKLHINGIMFDPNTQVVEYTFSSEINDATVLNDKVTFNIDNMKTTVLSSEMV